MFLDAGFSMEELMDIPAGRRRKYHDDATVMVIILGLNQRTTKASTCIWFFLVDFVVLDSIHLVVFRFSAFCSLNFLVFSSPFVYKESNEQLLFYVFIICHKPICYYSIIQWFPPSTNKFVLYVEPFNRKSFLRFIYCFFTKLPSFLSHVMHNLTES